MKQFEIDGIQFKVREFIPFTEMGSINLFGMMSVATKISKINAPYLAKYPIEDGEEAEDYRLRLQEQYTDEDQEAIQKLNYSNVTLMQPMLSCLIITPKLNTISMGIGIRLMSHPIVNEIIQIVMADLQGGMQGKPDSKN